jgi:apolipoprotein N-acyltransferase
VNNSPPNQQTTNRGPLWLNSLTWLALAVGCFHLAYTPSNLPTTGLFILGYAFGLVKLTDQPSVRRAFYFGLATGFLCAAPQLYFFWNIFSVAAVVLWLVFAFWIGLFTAISCGCIRRWGKPKAMWLIPFIWTGLEYFRSELYYLRFSWLNIGYVFPRYQIIPYLVFGMYGVGFLIFAVAAAFSGLKPVTRLTINIIWVYLVLIAVAAGSLAFIAAARYETPIPPVSVAGIQMEFPSAGILPGALNKALKKYPDAQIFVLSEYTLDGTVPDSLKHWCRDHSRYVVVGGKDFVTNDVYYNTAFVVGTNGEVVFKQAKAVPIQFFHDGLPATQQKVWDSPWGKIGICICYDLSYTRVTDALIKEGAQLLIVPTMDVEDWGRHQHNLHAQVAPVRAAEYGVPIFRLASSGISQAVSGSGTVLAQTRFGINGDLLAATFHLPISGARPPDRWLAPACVALTAIISAALLFLTGQERRARQPNSAAPLS